MKNRVIRALFAAAMAGLLAACGAPQGGGSYADNAPQSVQQEAVTAWRNPLGEMRTPYRHTPSDTPQHASAEERLGTQWGDEVASSVRVVTHMQRTGADPVDEAVLRYAGKAFRGRSIQALSLAAGKVEMRVQSDGRPLAMVRDGGDYYVQGKDGQAYQLVYRNLSGDAYEIVASVDGLDVLSGQAASRKAAGYILQPRATLVIEGFRKDAHTVASFLFAKPEDSYAANTPAGSIRNTGIIGTAVYRLYTPQETFIRPLPERPDAIRAFPADGDIPRYAPPPR